MFTTFQSLTPKSLEEHPASPEPKPRAKRSQVQRACQFCRLNRVKCDVSRPCRNCKEHGRRCIDGQHDIRSLPAALEYVLPLQCNSRQTFGSRFTGRLIDCEPNCRLWREKKRIPVRLSTGSSVVSNQSLQNGRACGWTRFTMDRLRYTTTLIACILFYKPLDMHLTLNSR